MAKYKSGEEAQVGDIVKCIAPVYEPYHRLCDDRTYKVTGTSHKVVRLEEHGDNTYGEERFILVKRTGAEPPQPQEQPMQEQPLVVWPEEEKQLTYKDVGHGELFVFIDTPQVVLRKVTYGSHVIFGDVFHSYHNASYHLDRPVRRLKLTTPPQFTVI